MMPDREPIANPVSEFLDGLLDERFGDAPEGELLRTIVINNSNGDPNGVIELLVQLHDKIGVFVTRLQDGEFKEWQPPVEPEPELTAEAEAVLELP